jgi:hypothetical protein
MTDTRCPACGARATGRFCSECGASVAGPPVRATHALRKDAADVIGLDERLVVTLRDLLMHPVRVVRAAMAGDRRTYLPPLKLFLALGGIYMLGLSIVQPFGFDASALRAMGVREESAARIETRIRDAGMSIDLFNERFHARMNTVAPLVTALAVLPLVIFLKLMDRHRAWHEHLMFMLSASNGVWLVSLLVLPVAFVGLVLHQLAIVAVAYGYLAIVFIPIYAARTRVRTAARFAIFASLDFAASLAFWTLLVVVVYASVLLV